MTARPSRAWTRFARRAGFDGNPLRRRSDVIAAWLLPAAILTFLILCPGVYAVTAMRVHADAAAARRASHSWHYVTGTLLQAAPGPEQSDADANRWTVLTPARWVTGGHAHTGTVPAAAGSPQGSQDRVLVNPAGQAEMRPMTAAQADDRIAADTMAALAALAVVLAGLAWAVRKVLDRRRLAGWETEWLAVGPRWSRQG
jgi:hypothetical protein